MVVVPLTGRIKVGSLAVLLATLLSAIASLGAVSPNSDLIGVVADVGQAKDVALDPITGLAYVASVQFGLTVVDVSAPLSPVAIGTANPPFYAEHVAVSGGVATVISGQFGMQTVDVSNPRAPKTLGYLSGTFRAAGMAGHYAYLAETIPGNPSSVNLDVVDVASPATPTLVGHVDLGSVGVGGVKAVGSLVYVAAGSSGLKVIDASQPTNPHIVGSVTLSGGASAVAVAGSYAYVSSGTALAVVSISSPSAPNIVGTLSGGASSSAVSQGRLYLLNGLQLGIVDVTVPSAPRLLGTSTNFSAQGLDAFDNIVLLATPQVDSGVQTGGLYVIDTTVPQSPKVLADVYAGYDDFSVAVDGPLAVVAGNSLGMRILDVSNASAPRISGEISGTLRAAAVVGTRAYVAETVPGNPASAILDVVDLTVPSAPSILGQMNLGPIAISDLKAVGQTVYMAAGSAGLKIIDVSDPANPRLLSTATPSGNVSAVTISGTYAYVGTSSTMTVVDVSNPSAPRLLGSVGMTPSSLAATDNRVYSISGTQLMIVDVSNPTSPQILSNSTNFGAQSVDLIGTTLFLARPAITHSDPDGGVWILDASDPAQPRVVEQIIVPGTTRAIAANGGFVYAGDSASTLDVIRYSPVAPAACTGDCNGDGKVSIGEVIECVNLFLAGGIVDPTNSCALADANANGDVSIGEVVQCANRFLLGCF